MKIVSKKFLNYKEDVYDITVEKYHNFALSNGIIVHNCAGHDLQRLLTEGFNGVEGRVSSKPAKHFREALGQMANFIGILQGEWAGAQAFSSFDTLLAPYVFFDMYYNDLTFTDIKKAILQFIYNLNVPSRWGQCFPSSYKCLRGDGRWVAKDDLKIGDEIYVVDMETGSLKKDTIIHLNEFDAPKKMHRYNNKQGFNFQVTPNHRVIYKTGSNPYSIKESSELMKYSSVSIPIKAWNPEIENDTDYDISDDMLEMLIFIMTDGCISKQENRSAKIEFFKSPKRYGIERFEELCEKLGITYSNRKESSGKFGEESYVKTFRLHVNDVTKKITELLNYDKHKMPDFFGKLSSRQCKIVLDTWVKLDGHTDGIHWRMQADNKEIQEMLAFLCVKSLQPTTLVSRTFKSNKKPTNYTLIHKRDNKICTIEEVDPITEKVWCPTTNTGTVVCMTDEGYVFLSGNCPFSNITLDRVVPKDMQDQYPMRGDEQYFVSIFKEYFEKEKNGHLERMLDIALKRLIKTEDLNERDRENILTSGTKEEVLNALSLLTYRHFQPEMEIIIKAFYECLNEGDILGQPFTFPIPTVNITEDFEWDGEVSDIIFENAAKYGSSYFQNFIGSQYKRNPETGKLEPDPDAYRPDDVRSMCPLSLDTEILTNNGIKQLKDLDPDKDKVYNSICSNRSGKLVSFTKTPIFTDHNVLKVTFSDGSIVKMSEHHDQPIWNDGEHIIKASELKINNIILSINKEDNKAYFVKVTNIENIGVEPVQCITLDTNDDPYFILGNGIVTSNCRLQLDKRALRKKGGGLFGSDSQTGSIGNVTFNMPRLGYLYKGNYAGLIKTLDEYIDLSVEGHEAKRKFVTELNERGFFPYTRRWVKTFDTFFSTIGLNGMNEMVRNFTNDEHDITDEYGQKMCKDIMDHIREKLVEIQEKTDHLYNLEASPGEGTVRRFAASDKAAYPDIIQAGNGEGVPYYTNSAQLPVDFSDDVFAALDLQDELQQKWTGGTVFHVYTNEQMTTETCKTLVKKILSNYRLPYISITPTLCICPIHGRLEGYHEYCPICDKELIKQHADEVDINK